MVREDIVFSVENKDLIEQNIDAIQELWKEYGKVEAAALKERQINLMTEDNTGETIVVRPRK